MPKNIVICCDGTGNEIGETISNVLKLYRILNKTEQQRVYYNPGVGTIGLQNTWQRFKQNATGVFGLATGYGLDNDVLSAYRFLSETYEEGDQIWLFGFSRGAYTARSTAGFVRNCGILRREHVDRIDEAYALYRDKSSKTHPRGMEATLFRRAYSCETRIHFIGVWDTRRPPSRITPCARSRRSSAQARSVM